MNLNNFTKYIPVRILSRGFDIFEYDEFESIEKVNDDTYHFIYEGTDVYEIVISLTETHEILTSACTCPYYYSEHCKHEVAAYFYLNEHIDSLEVSKARVHLDSFDAFDTDVDGGHEDSLEALLEDVSKEDIIEIMKTLSISNHNLKNAILNYKQLPNEREMIRYVNQLQMDLERAWVIEDPIFFDSIIETLKSWIPSLATLDNYHYFIDYFLKIVGLLNIQAELTINYFDWEYEMFWDNVETVLKLFSDSLEKNSDGFENQMLFEYLDLKKNQTNEGDIFNLALSLPITKVNHHTVKKLCASYLDNEEVRRTELIKYHEVMKAYMRDAELLDYYLKYLQVEAFQIEALNILHKHEAHDKSLSLILQIRHEYKRIADLDLYLYDAYFNSDHQLLALNFANLRIKEGSVAMLKHLKQTLNPEKFLAVSKDYLHKSFYHHGKVKKDIYAHTLVFHEKYQQLFKYLTEHLDDIPRFSQHFNNSQILALYSLYIFDMIEIADARNYEAASGVLLKLKYDGYEEEAQEIKRRILRQYKNRPALIKTLNFI